MPPQDTAAPEATGGYERPAKKGLWSDFVSFFLRRPRERTLIDLSSPGARAEYDQRVFERLGISVADNDVLNIHRIGIDAPDALVWDVWSRRDANTLYWPTRIAFPAWHDGNGAEGKLLLFGHPALPIFRADLIRRCEVPADSDPNRARYALYRCSGGYPMGVFAMYVRPRTAADDTDATQVFFLVAFDFFGKKQWLGTRAVRPIWEPIHNRVTSHVLNRFKAHCLQVYAQSGGLGGVATRVPRG